MGGFVALLRAVNVGGTGKLPMATLQKLCKASGLQNSRTYIASGNVVFSSDSSEDEIRLRLESQLEAYAGRRVGVIVRSASEISEVLANNPFSNHPFNRVMALFVDGQLQSDPMQGVVGRKNEEIRLGKRELYVHYPDGMATTRLRVPAERFGTSRNMNTISKLAEMVSHQG